MIINNDGGDRTWSFSTKTLMAISLNGRHGRTKKFWKTAQLFRQKGKGFSIVRGRAVSTAFSAYRIDHYLEIGIETAEEYRRNGFTRAVCTALIRYCLISGLTPVWGCRMETPRPESLRKSWVLWLPKPCRIIISWKSKIESNILARKNCIIRKSEISHIWYIWVEVCILMVNFIHMFPLF